MARVLVVSTSKKTRGGITTVLKLYEQSSIWSKYHCKWIGTHRDGSLIRKLWYVFTAFLQYIVLLPFYDIVHIHFSLRVSAKRKLPFFKLAKAFGKKTVIHLHCGSQIDDIWNEQYQYMFEQCDCGVLLSETLKDRIEEHIGKSDKLRVIYNPCPIITNTAQYEKHNIILFSGTLYEGKGYKDLIKAFAKIASNHREWMVVFAGNGEEAHARLFAQELGVDNQIKLLGWVSGEAKHKAFCEAKALCLPSYAEGFPMAVLDGWAYGLPVISTPVGGVPDVAIDGENMLLFNPGDVDALADRLERVITNSALREKIAEESIKLSQGRFSLRKVTEQVGEIYESLIL